SLGQARFRYFQDNQYHLTATVQGSVDAVAPLTAATDVLVDGSGPALGCGSLDGAILRQAPGTSVTLSGTVSDLDGVQSVTVNGQATPVSTGKFTTNLPSAFGINFIDLVAVDGVGKESSRSCAFLVAGDFIPEGQAFADAISMKLTQAAVDDGNRSGAMTSVGDILHNALNSDQLKALIHQQLLAANPIKPDSCAVAGPL